MKKNAILSLVVLALSGCRKSATPTNVSLPDATATAIEESRASAEGALAREYPDWATSQGPLPGRVVGLALTPTSKWGQSFEWIGDAVIARPEAYLGRPAQHTGTYQIHAAGIAPRMLGFAPRDARWPLRGQAHLVEVEIAGGKGLPAMSSFDIAAHVTGVKLLDGTPGYPKSAAAALDAARARFDAFAREQAPRIASLVAAESGPAKSPGRIAGGLFAWWDDDRRRLTVVLQRRHLHVAVYETPCMMIYEGMPPAAKSMTVVDGFGVYFGQRIELDATGTPVSARSFEPAVYRESRNVPEPDADALRRGPPCPNSPGLNRQYHPSLPEPE